MNLTLKQAAEALEFSTNTVRKLIADNKLPAVVIPHNNGKRLTYRIDDSAIRQFKRTLKVVPAPASESSVPPITATAPSSDKLVSASDIKKMLGCGDAFIYDRVKRGVIATQMVNGRMMFDSEAVEQLRQFNVLRLRKQAIYAPLSAAQAPPTAGSNIGAIASVFAASKALAARVTALERRMDELIAALGGNL